LLVPVLPSCDVAVIVTPVFAVGIVTEKLERTPLTKFVVVVGVIEPLLTERVTDELNPVYVLPYWSFAVIVIVKGVFSV
jgi:hypothetical protein